MPLGPANTMIQIPPLAPGNEVMPMMAPDVRYAFCRFDLAQGPVRLKGSVPSDLWMIASLHARRRQFLHRARRRYEKRAARPGHCAGRSNGGGSGRRCSEDADELFVIKSPAREGVAIIRAPLSGPSRMARTEDALKATVCSPLKK